MPNKSVKGPHRFSDDVPITAIAAAAAATLMALGGFSPWVRGIGGLITVNGTEGEGWWVVAAGALALVSLVAYAVGRRAWAIIVAGIAALVGAGFSIYYVLKINNEDSMDFFGAQIDAADVGWGLYLSLVASIALVGCLVALWRQRPT